MITLSINGAETGRAIAGLQQALELRAKAFGRGGRQLRNAVVSTAINLLVSLRKVTRKPTTATLGTPKIVDTGMFGSWTRHGGRNQRCIRSGDSPRSPRVTPALKVSWTSAAVADDKHAHHVYGITPVNQRKPAYLLVAKSAADAQKFEKRRVQKAIRLLGGTAKDALSIAMSRISTRSPAMTGGRLAHGAAAKRVSAGVSQSGNGFSVVVHDNLEYALYALRGGRSALDVAMMKAANRTVGIVRHYFEKHGLDTTDAVTPFPEVANA